MIILTVIPPISPLAYSGEVSPTYIPELEDNLKKSHQRLLKEAEKIVKSNHPDLKVITRLEYGRPSDIIVETTGNEDVDLIVMGSRGIGGITGWILGSTSRHVIEHCTKPILIIK